MSKSHKHGSPTSNSQQCSSMSAHRGVRGGNVFAQGQASSRSGLGGVACGGLGTSSGSFRRRGSFRRPPVRPPFPLTTIGSSGQCRQSSALFTCHSSSSPSSSSPSSAPPLVSVSPSPGGGVVTSVVTSRRSAILDAISASFRAGAVATMLLAASSSSTWWSAQPAYAAEESKSRRGMGRYIKKKDSANAAAVYVPLVRQALDEAREIATGLGNKTATSRGVIDAIRLSFRDKEMAAPSALAQLRPALRELKDGAGLPDDLQGNAVKAFDSLDGALLAALRVPEDQVEVVAEKATKPADQLVDALEKVSAYYADVSSTLATPRASDVEAALF